ncbi:hypothetical protein BV20DRAFT_135141 [Pilatotrama ljubarskyi]|nr:hypothetical protein BV20DRAFT_135141 [Pilatotrama ljubarskyi]
MLSLRESDNAACNSAGVTSRPSPRPRKRAICSIRSVSREYVRALGAIDGSFRRSAEHELHSCGRRSSFRRRHQAIVSRCRLVRCSCTQKEAYRDPALSTFELDPCLASVGICCSRCSWALAVLMHLCVYDTTNLLSSISSASSAISPEPRAPAMTSRWTDSPMSNVIFPHPSFLNVERQTPLSLCPPPRSQGHSPEHISPDREPGSAVHFDGPGCSACLLERSARLPARSTR